MQQDCDWDQRPKAFRGSLRVQFTPEMIAGFWRMFRAGDPVADGIAPRIGVSPRIMRNWMKSIGLPQGAYALSRVRADLNRGGRWVDGTGIVFDPPGGSST